MWGLRYLPLSNYSWWFTVYQLWAYLTSLAVAVYIIAEWPWSAHLLKAGGLALLASHPQAVLLVMAYAYLLSPPLGRSSNGFSAPLSTSSSQTTVLVFLSGP